GARRATLIGRMLQVFGSDQMMIILDPLNARINTCDEATKLLRSRGIAPTFYTLEHHITIEEASAAPLCTQAACTIVVLSPDTLESWGEIKKSLNEKSIILINKMDIINWDMKEFQSIVERLECDSEKIPILPISAFHNDNVYEKVHEKALWYGDWMAA
ncbi:hypothetical protein IFR05_017442, partial [Cadophora sp. M221]